MLSPDLRRAAQPAVRLQLILWVAFAATAPVYVLVAHLVAGGAREASPASGEGLTLVIGLAAAALAAGAFWYRGRALADARLRRVMDGSTPAGGIGAPDPGLVAGLPAGEQRLAGLLPHLQTTLIVSLGMAEAVTLCGLVLAIVQGRPAVILPFAGLGLAITALLYPRPLAILARAGKLARRA